MRFILLILLTCCFQFGYGQVVFSETFDEVDEETVGTDGISAVAWTALCPGSLAATDYFKVLSNRLEARDTNSPSATWETGDIDISSCDGVEISFDMSELSDMEDCSDCPAGGTGFECIDWVKLEYNLDGGGWTDVAGTTCPLAESPGDMIQFGNIPGGGPITYTSPCIDFGTTLAIRISCMSWAAAEVWRFDNITVSCVSCILPVEIGNFSAMQEKNNVNLSWTTLSEINNDYFTVERSENGISYETINKTPGAGNSTEVIDYSFIDRKPISSNIIYYRLSQTNFDGEITSAKTIALAIQTDIKISTQNKSISYTLNDPPPPGTLLLIYNRNGQIIHQEEINQNGTVALNKSGFFIIAIPHFNYSQKIVLN